MLVRFTYHVLADELCEHCHRAGVDADRVGPGLVQIGEPGARRPREVESILRAWERLHPEAPAELVSDTAAGV